MATIRWCPIFPKWDSYQPLYGGRITFASHMAKNSLSTQYPVVPAACVESGTPGRMFCWVETTGCCLFGLVVSNFTNDRFIFNVNPGLINHGLLIRGTPPIVIIWYLNGTPPIKQPRGLLIQGWHYIIWFNQFQTWNIVGKLLTRPGMEHAKHCHAALIWWEATIDLRRWRSGMFSSTMDHSGGKPCKILLWRFKVPYLVPCLHSVPATITGLEPSHDGLAVKQKLQKSWHSDDPFSIFVYRI